MGASETGREDGREFEMWAAVDEGGCEAKMHNARNAFEVRLVQFGMRWRVLWLVGLESQSHHVEVDLRRLPVVSLPTYKRI